MTKPGINFLYRYALLFTASLLLTNCTQMSEKETDDSAGLNGGFEVSKNGLPVNWLMYTPKTVPNSDFEINLDTIVFKEGKQSLRFRVKECSQTGGWHSPGFTNEFFDIDKFEGEGTYTLSLWVKNDSAAFRISGGGVAPYKGNMKILIEVDHQIDDWKYLEYQIYVPQDFHLRMQMNVIKPGTFWIDDVKIVKNSTPS